MDRGFAVETLESDVSDGVRVRQSFPLEFAFDRRAVRADFFVGPLAHVHFVDQLAVEPDLDGGAFADDFHFVPFTRRFRHDFFRGLVAVECAVSMIVRFGSGIVQKLDLDRVRDPVAFVRAFDQETGVGVFGQFVFERDLAVADLFLRPDRGITGCTQFAVFIDGPDAGIIVCFFQIIAEQGLAAAIRREAAGSRENESAQSEPNFFH